MTRWYLAKYIPDLRRGEPRNIGVLLSTGGRTFAKFLAEDSEGRIDGRSLRTFSSSSNYRAWVRRWRSDLNRVNSDEEFNQLVRRRAGANYFLEPSGETNSPVADPQLFLSSLFSELVSQAEDETRTTEEKLIEEDPFDTVFSILGILDKVEKSVWVHGANPSDNLYFDRKFANGKDHFFRQLTLPNAEHKSWDLVHAVAWSTKQLLCGYQNGGREASSIALIDSSHGVTRQQVECLEGSGAKAIDVRDPIEAAGRLRPDLHLSVGALTSRW